LSKFVPHTRHVTATFRAASATDREHGREWYDRAHRLARELAASTEPADMDDAVRRAAAVIAVLSPVTSWPQNVAMARAAYYGWPVKGLGRNIAKAKAIMSGADPDTVVSGRKVRAFWATIVDPSLSDAVVVDRHAIDIALGTVTDDATRSRIVGRKGGYEAIAAAYHRAARILTRELGEPISPAQVQAITWVYWRRTRSIIRRVENAA